MTTSKTTQGRIFWGLFLIALGILFLLDQMGQLDFGHLISHYWPAIFIIIGLSILVGSNFRNTGPALFFILFGTFFLLMEMRIFGHRAWHYAWPIFIIGAGFWILVRPALAGGKKKIPEISADDLRVSAVFGGVERAIDSKNFRGGRGDAVFGSLELDMRQAALAGGQATLELSVVLGGIELRVPRTWNIVIQGSPVLGAIEDKRKPVPEAEKTETLFIKASAVLGGIEVGD